MALVVGLVSFSFSLIVSLLLSRYVGVLIAAVILLVLWRVSMLWLIDRWGSFEERLERRDTLVATASRAALPPRVEALSGPSVRKLPPSAPQRSGIWHVVEGEVGLFYVENEDGVRGPTSSSTREAAQRVADRRNAVARDKAEPDLVASSEASDARLARLDDPVEESRA